MLSETMAFALFLLTEILSLNSRDSRSKAQELIGQISRGLESRVTYHGYASRCIPSIGSPQFLIVVLFGVQFYRRMKCDLNVKRVFGRKVQLRAGTEPRVLCGLQCTTLSILSTRRVLFLQTVGAGDQKRTVE